MSTENTPQDETKNTTEDTEVVVDQDQQPTEDQVEAKPQEDRPGREAAKYRTRLREAEAERDALAERLAVLQRAEVERVAGTKLENPAGLWAAGVELEQVLDEDGNVDPDKVTEATVAAAETLGLARKRPGNYVPSEGANARPLGRRTGEDGMVDVLMGRRF